MKKLISMATLLLIAFSTFAQATHQHEKHEGKTDSKYCCSKCDHCSSKAGKCAHHKMALIKEGTYYCPMCDGSTSEQPGKCSKCGMEMTKMEIETETKYCCPKDDWSVSPIKGNCPPSTSPVTKDGILYCVSTHDNPGKCSKCGMEMEKIEIKKKKGEEEHHNHKH